MFWSLQLCGKGTSETPELLGSSDGFAPFRWEPGFTPKPLQDSGVRSLRSPMQAGPLPVLNALDKIAERAERTGYCWRIHAVSCAKRLVRLVACGRFSHQVPRRARLMAAAVITCCRWVF